MSQKNTSKTGATESLDVAVGRRVHMLMWERRITQTALGRLIGIDQSNLGKRLRGERSWGLDDLRAVADVLEVSIAYLVGETESPDPVNPGRGLSLPGLDSNQEPADSAPGEVVHVDFTRRKVVGE